MATKFATCPTCSERFNPRVDFVKKDGRTFCSPKCARRHKPKRRRSRPADRDDEHEREREQERQLEKQRTLRVRVAAVIVMLLGAAALYLDRNQARAPSVISSSPPELATSAPLGTRRRRKGSRITTCSMVATC